MKRPTEASEPTPKPPRKKRKTPRRLHLEKRARGETYYVRRSPRAGEAPLTYWWHGLLSVFQGYSDCGRRVAYRLTPESAKILRERLGMKCENADSTGADAF